MWKRAAIVLVGLIVLAGVAGAALLMQNGQPHVLRTIRLEQGGHGLLLDERSGYAFVTTPAVFNNNKGLLRIVDARSGTLIRHISLPDVSGMKLDDTTGHLFVTYSSSAAAAGGLSSNGVLMLDSRSGRLLRQVPLAGNPSALVLDSPRHRLFISVTGLALCAGGACRSSRVVMLDTRSGTTVRQFAVRGYVGLMEVDRSGTRLIAISYVKLGFPGMNSTMIIFDTASGRVVAGQPLPGLPVLTLENTLLVDSASGHVFLSVNSSSNGSGSVIDMIDARSGRVVRTVPVGSPVSRIVADGRQDNIFALTLGPVIMRYPAATRGPIASGEGQLYVLDGRTGQVKHTFRACLIPLAIAVDARRDHLLVACVGQVYNRPANGSLFDGPGMLNVIDEHTGSLLSTTPIGVLPEQVAVDGQSGHAVVVDQGGTVRAADAWGWVPGWMRRWLPFIPRPTGGTRTAPADVTIVDVSR